MAEACQWLENYRKFWEGSFERLDTLLEELNSYRTEKEIE
ncbi:toxin-antitoxin system, antitoxin component, ArsR family [Leptospira fainei serovar Hurstbridge str. BUT 6]|uniref:Toxin-antitoxin system, antitoxin component, ArsR family n=1 Tax=Leptospira fainei serovar Hurstbridge str. BUT 6 TaxID=1193011 RepID=S3V454_9LEPT|nr:toxin-antitoxin system, antitoxin component, ArsR family [Leptospira fainei serovar Hurstbridge str. BUT 6]